MHVVSIDHITLRSRVGSLFILTALAALGFGCGENTGSSAPSAAPTTALGQPTDPNQPPPGHVFITVAASSLPAGATVTGGGQMLGMTPLTVRVPVPVAQPGQAQTFQFTFQLPGYQPATISASPINSTITLNAALAPIEVASSGSGSTPSPPDDDDAGDDTRESFTVRGPAGGAIYDRHTTTSTARVTRACVIASLRVNIQGNHTYNSDLGVTLSGPDGTVYPLQNRESRTPFRVHTVRRAAGRPSQGAWTLAIADLANADSGNLRGWTMTVRCR